MAHEAILQKWQSAKSPLVIYLSEFIGTALLLFLGMTVVILNFGDGNPVAKLITGDGVRRVITGLLFGSVGALISISPVGKISGAHINPTVTIFFYLSKKINGRHAVGYIVAQLLGAIIGCLPLIVFGKMGASIKFGATVPGPGYTAYMALLGEAITTFCLVLGLIIFLGHIHLRKFTPLLFPFLYSVMVYLEAPISGTSTNPARSLGPEVISVDFNYWWIYWVGPILGMAAASAFHKIPIMRFFKIEVAKLYHFEHDKYGIFHKIAR